jgi:predicted ATPase
LELGPFTVLVGANASGKSNLRDAFRFLHGVARGYSLAEIIGEKWVEGGVLQWRGIRGGIREAAYGKADSFALEVAFPITLKDETSTCRYRIEVQTGGKAAAPRVVAEGLWVEGRKLPVLLAEMPKTASRDQFQLMGNLHWGKLKNSVLFKAHEPVLTQMATGHRLMAPFNILARQALEALGSMRFLDLAPDAMRMPSIPGQIILGDRGENLATVLQAICGTPSKKRTLVEWVKRLTPLDVSDFEFVPDATGRITLVLVEANGQRTSAYSASDGTLRFLTMMAALLGPEPAQFYFFEELENGIHPTRLHLLIQLMERKVVTSTIQIVATTHSPQLMGFLSPETREHAALVYRLPAHPDARIQQIMTIPDARRVLEKQDLARLHSSGWLEDAMFFLQGEEAEE